MASIETLQQLDSLLKEFAGDAHMLRYINQNLVMPKLKAAHDVRMESFARNYQICDIGYVKFDGKWYPCLLDGFTLADENGVVRDHTKAELPTSNVYAYYYYDSADNYDSYTVDLLTLGKVIHIRRLDGETDDQVMERIQDELKTICDTYPNHCPPQNAEVFFEVIRGYLQ